MNSLPVVSVIMIFLNEEKFIEEAVHSVLSQRYDNWELLLVDDGSTDASTAIARKFAQQYPEKVRYLEHKGHTNRGMSASRNLGMHHARGKYIALLDGDDVWLPFMILPIFGALERIPHSFIEASRDLGASGFATFRRVVLPLALPGVVA